MTVRGTTLVLTLSLVANAALLAVIEIKDPGILRFSTLNKATPLPSVVASTPGADFGRSALSPRSVEELLKGDASTVIARLRAAGFPRYIVRAIAQAKVEELLHDREMEVVARLKPKPYWQARNNNNLDRIALADMRSINRERSKMVEALIGTDPSDINPFGGIFTESQRGGLPPDTYRKVDAVKADYDDMRGRIYAATNGVLLPEDKEKLAYLDKQQSTDLAAVVSPDELLDYQMHVSQDASNLRDALTAFNPNEDEFRAIYKAQQDVNAQLGATDGPLTAEQQQARQAALLTAVQQILSPERFAEYKTDTDPAYVNVDRVVQQMNLPPETTQQVVAMQTDYSQQAAAINGDSQIAPADKITQLNALADEATTKLTAALGTRGFYAYQQANGSWLQQLKAKGR